MNLVWTVGGGGGGTSTPVVGKFNSSTTSISAGINTQIVFSNVEVDTNSGYSVSTGNNTVAVTGYYDVTAYVETNQGSAGASILKLYKNGSLYALIGGLTNSGQGQIWGAIGSVPCSAGDTLGIFVNFSFNTSADSDCYFTIGKR